MTDKLPEWYLVSKMLADGAELDPVEQFIYDHEPAGKEEEQWREDLYKLIEYVGGY